MPVSDLLRPLHTLALLACIPCAALAVEDCVPVLISGDPAPEYSELGRRAGVQGIVMLAATIPAEGSVPQKVEVVQELGWGLDEEAVRAVSKWRFRPAKCESRFPAVVPVECHFSGPITGDIHFGPISFDATSEVRKPELNIFVPPDFHAGADVRSTVGTVQFTVDERGQPVNFHVERPSGPDLDRAVLLALRDWRFEPATKDGAVVRVRGTVTYSARNR